MTDNNSKFSFYMQPEPILETVGAKERGQIDGVKRYNDIRVIEAEWVDKELEKLGITDTAEATKELAYKISKESNLELRKVTLALLGRDTDKEIQDMVSGGYAIELNTLNESAIKYAKELANIRAIAVMKFRKGVEESIAKDFLKSKNGSLMVKPLNEFWNKEEYGWESTNGKKLDKTK